MLIEEFVKKGLSNREGEVAELVARGLTNKEVANNLFVTEKTVKFHLTNIYKKIGVKSRVQLIVWAMPHIGIREDEPASTIPTTEEMHNVISRQNEKLPEGAVG